MALVAAERALADTQRAFDGVADSYHRSNAANPLLCAMRERTRRALTRAVAPGASVLDLGCGPGTDDVTLGRLGYRVTAIDWSPAMVREARHHVDAAGLGRRVRVEHLGIHQLDRLAPQQYDAVFSNFGALNCVTDLAGAARAIGERMRPHGVCVVSVIGRLCPWELALYLARGDWKRAAVRFSREPVPVPLEGRTVWTRYFWPRELVKSFADAGFSVVSQRGVGVLAPPPYLQAFAARHPWLVATLHRADDRVGGWPGLRSCGDHFVLVLRRARS